MLEHVVDNFCASGFCRGAWGELRGWWLLSVLIILGVTSPLLLLFMIFLVIKKNGQECVAFWRFHKLNCVRQIVIDAGCTWQFSCGQQLVHYERFEPRGRFLSRWSMIIWLNVVLNRTVVDSGWRFDDLCSNRLQGQRVLYHFWW